MPTLALAEVPQAVERVVRRLCHLRPCAMVTPPLAEGPNEGRPTPLRWLSIANRRAGPWVGHVRAWQGSQRQSPSPAFGFIAYDAVTQVASAAPPPVVTTDYAAYPAPGSVPATCTGGLGCRRGAPGLPGLPAATRRADNVAPFVDPGPGAPPPAASMRRFQTQIQVGDQVVIRWDSWTPGCESLAISFPLKATNRELLRPHRRPGAGAGAQRAVQLPVLLQLGRRVLPEARRRLRALHHDPAAQRGLRLPARRRDRRSPRDRRARTAPTTRPRTGSMRNTAGLGTFNPNRPEHADRRGQRRHAVLGHQRIVVDKEWVGTGTVPPSNLPAGFQLTVTSSVSQTNASVLGTATCGMVAGTFTCNYADTAAPGVPQGGLLVNADSLLTVSETSLPRQHRRTSRSPSACRVSSSAAVPNGGACQFTVTNTPPPPPPPPTTEPAAHHDAAGGHDHRAAAQHGAHYLADDHPEHAAAPRARRTPRRSCCFGCGPAAGRRRAGGRHPSPGQRPLVGGPARRQLGGRARRHLAAGCDGARATTCRAPSRPRSRCRGTPDRRRRRGSSGWPSPRCRTAWPAGTARAGNGPSAAGSAATARRCTTATSRCGGWAWRRTGWRSWTPCPSRTTTGRRPRPACPSKPNGPTLCSSASARAAVAAGPRRVGGAASAGTARSPRWRGRW